MARIIERHPTVCFVDGLAYDNPPGSRHATRWEDAQETLRQDWEQHQHSWALDWNAASPAIRDAWDRPLQPGDTQSAADQRSA